MILVGVRSQHPLIALTDRFHFIAPIFHSRIVGLGEIGTSNHVSLSLHRFVKV